MRVIASSASSHCVALGLAVDAEAAELGLRARLAGAELDAAAGDQVERRDALGDARGMVEAGRDLHDAVARAGCSSSAGSRRPGTPRARSSASTPRGSGARPPRRSRCRPCRRARPARARRSAASPRRPRPRAAAAGARRRCRISSETLLCAGRCAMCGGAACVELRAQAAVGLAQPHRRDSLRDHAPALLEHRLAARRRRAAAGPGAG